MAVTLEGSIAEQLGALEDIVAASSTFQGLVNVATADEAKASIYWGELTRGQIDKGVEVLIPCCIIRPAEHGTNQVAEGVEIMLDPSFSHLVVLFWPNKDEYRREWQDAVKDAYVTAGQFIDDLIDQSGEGEYGFSTHRMINAPLRTPITERDHQRDFWQAAFALVHEGA